MSAGEPKKSAKQIIYEYAGELLERPYNAEPPATLHAKFLVLETLASRCGYMDLFHKIKNRRNAISCIPQEQWWQK